MSGKNGIERKTGDGYCDDVGLIVYGRRRYKIQVRWPRAAGSGVPDADN